MKHRTAYQKATAKIEKEGQRCFALMTENHICDEGKKYDQQRSTESGGSIPVEV